MAGPIPLILALARLTRTLSLRITHVYTHFERRDPEMAAFAPVHVGGRPSDDSIGCIACGFGGPR